jgi:hypothetical protein
MECHEFRALLLVMRSDLREAMIPHRTKFRELIIYAWKDYFLSLKESISVLPIICLSL